MRDVRKGRCWHRDAIREEVKQRGRKLTYQSRECRNRETLDRRLPASTNRRSTQIGHVEGLHRGTRERTRWTEGESDCEVGEGGSADREERSIVDRPDGRYAESPPFSSGGWLFRGETDK